VAAGPEVGLHIFWQGCWHRKAAEVSAVLAERADEVSSREARRLKCILGAHAEFNVVKDDLDGCLILLVAARYRDRDDRLVVVEKQRWAQRDSRPLARLYDVGSSCIRVQTAEPASVNYAGASGDAGSAGQAARSRRDDVSKFIRHAHDRSSAMPWAGDRGWLGRLHIVGIARPELERCLFRIDQLAPQFGIPIRKQLLHRHLRKVRIAVLLVAICQRELLRFNHRVDVVRRIETHLF
jgi:hypothetical protein